MPLTRRDVLWSLGGGVAGVALGPVPWKLLDDTAIWTQRRHALPVPPRGEVTWRPAACTLCPGGCAVRVRRVGGRPVSVVPEAAHPLGGGACPLGLTLHHLPFHPLRLGGPSAGREGRRRAIALDEAVARIARAVEEARTSGLRAMVLDRRPGRVVSAAWRSLMAALPHGCYATHPGEGETLAVLARALRAPRPLGLDLERTRTLLSLGAPVLEGWGRPGRMVAVRDRLHVVQVDARRSLSAALADEWIPLAPGGEGPLALALAHVVLREQAAPRAGGLRSLVDFPPRDAAPRTGVDAARVETLARALVRGGPSVAVGGGDPGGGPLSPEAEQAIALLDVALGAVGRPGGVVARRPVPGGGAAPEPHAVDLRDVAEGSVGVLFLDAADDGRALPWPLLRRVLATDAIVVSLSPFEGALAREADLLVPAPAPLEAWDEVLPGADAAAASYAVTTPVLEPPPGATDPLELVRRLAAALGSRVEGTHEERLRERVAAIHSAGRGRLFARADGGFEERAAGDAGDLWGILVAGGCWIDDAGAAVPLDVRAAPLAAAVLERWRAPDPETGGLSLVSFAARGTVGTTPPSPLLTKLYQESDLRTGVALAAVGPETAQGLGLAHGQPVRLEGAAGAVGGELRIDPAMPPGRVAVAAGPERAALHPGARAAAGGALPLAVAAVDGTWRGTRVRIREA
jgi:anaerobic selenocysteine-containing dehydrogenase